MFFQGNHEKTVLQRIGLRSQGKTKCSILITAKIRFPFFTFLTMHLEHYMYYNDYYIPPTKRVNVSLKEHVENKMYIIVLHDNALCYSRFLNFFDFII